MKESIDFKLIGSRIKEKRIKLHITQQKMADDLSISKFYISKIEHGKVKATLETLAEISNYLDIDFGFLITGVSPLSNDYGTNEFYSLFKQASPEQKEKILTIIKTILS